MDHSELALLLSYCSDGDPQAIARFYAAYHLDVYRLALSILDDPGEADEAAQEALLRAIDRLPSYRGEASFKSWLYAITVNMCRGRLRKQRVRQRLQQTLFGLFGQGETRPIHPEEQVIQNELDSALWQSIHALPEALRLTITLRYYHALPIGEIAQIMQVSQRTVHNRLSDAHSRLRAALEEKVVTE